MEPNSPYSMSPAVQHITHPRNPRSSMSETIIKVGHQTFVRLIDLIGSPFSNLVIIVVR